MSEYRTDLHFAKSINELKVPHEQWWRDVFELELDYPYDIPYLAQVIGIAEHESNLDSSDYKLRHATDKQKLFIYLRDNRQCSYCHIYVDPRNMQADHLMPFSKGGETRVSNLVCSCKRCNYAKGVMEPGDFIDLMKDDERGIEERDRLYFAWLGRTREQKGYY